MEQQYLKFNNNYLNYHDEQLRSEYYSSSNQEINELGQLIEENEESMDSKSLSSVQETESSPSEANGNPFQLANEEPKLEEVKVNEHFKTFMPTIPKLQYDFKSITEVIDENSSICIT